MRILLALVAALAAAWCGYWFIGASAVRSGVTAWFEAREADGWEARYSDLDVQGFPSRFDTTISDIALADPASGLGWRAPFFQVLTLSYTPNHVIALWPHEQRIVTPLRAYTLTSTDMRASLHVAASTALELERAILTAEGLALASEEGGGAWSADALRLAAERADPAPGETYPRYHLGLAADAVAAPAALMVADDAGEALPRVIDSIAADVTVTFDAPWDRHALEDIRPQPTRIAVKSSEIRWGNMRLGLSGVLVVGPGGRPDGRLTVRAHNWRRMLDAAKGAGLLQADMVETVRRALGALAEMGDDPKSLEVPLRFEGGRVWIGPLPLGPAPVLRLR